MLCNFPSLTCRQHIDNWFGNHANSSLPESVQAKSAGAVLHSLLTGFGPPKKHRQMLKAYFAYHELDRERLDPILRDLWEEEKRVKKYTNNDHRLAFTNETLKVMLKAESQEKKDEVDRFRKADLERRKEEDRAAEEAEYALLLPGESELPEEEKSRLMLVRSRYR